MTFWNAFLKLRNVIDERGYDSISKKEFVHHYNKVNHNIQESDIGFITKAMISRMLYNGNVSHTTDMRITLKSKTILKTGVIDIDNLIEYSFIKSKSFLPQKIISLEGISEGTTIGELKNRIKFMM